MSTTQEEAKSKPKKRKPINKNFVFDEAKAKDVFDKAKTQLLMWHPFYANLLLKFNMIFTQQIPIAAADHEKVYINLEGLMEITDYDQRKIQFVLSHEVMHLVFQHVPLCKRLGLEPKLHNVAADYVINQMLIDGKVGTVPTTLDKDNKEIQALLVDKELVEKFDYDTISIYNHIKENWTRIQCKCEECGYGFDEYVNPKDMTKEEAAKLESEMKLKLAEAYASAKMMGKTPAGVEKLIDSFLEAKICWKTQLQNYLTSYIESYERGYERLNRRAVNLGLVLPSCIDELGMKDILICMDTSGSCVSELENFAAEINAIKETYSLRMRVLYCDSALANEQIFESEEPLVLNTMGGGGTDFSPALQRADELLSNSEIGENSLLIYFTDLEGSFPQSCDINVLWCVVGKEYHVPFGDVIHIHEK